MMHNSAVCRLLWGQAGQSNALAIAEGLGFSRQIVADARKVRAAIGFEIMGEQGALPWILVDTKRALLWFQCQQGAAN